MAGPASEPAVPAPPIRAIICAMGEEGEEFDRVLLAVLRALHRRGARYVLVGGGAVILHGLPRLTQDIDLFLPTDAANLGRVKDALRDVFEDPAIDEIRADDLAADYAVVRYGPPGTDLLIDLMVRIGEAFRFEDLEAEEMDVEGVRVCVATPRTLYRMKDALSHEERHAPAEGSDGRRGPP